MLRVGESTESLRYMVATIAETKSTVQGNRINSIMKTSVLIIGLSLVLYAIFRGCDWL